MEEITVCLTENEILETPNDSMLGEKVRKILWETKTIDNNENTEEQND